MIEFLVKGVYGLKFFNLAEGEQPLYTQWYSNAKDVVICGHDVADVDDNHCALKSISKEEKSGYSVWDCVSSGITNSVFAIS